jgi:hypothetical protein
MADNVQKTDSELTEDSKGLASNLPALNWRTRVLIIGGVCGAVVGVTAAYLLAQKSNPDEPPDITIGEGVKIGVLIFGLLRSISNL